MVSESARGYTLTGRELIQILRERVPELHLPPAITRLEIIADVKDASRITVEFIASEKKAP